MLQVKLVSGFYQGPIKALQATGAVWWSRWGSRCRPVKVFFFSCNLVWSWNHRVSVGWWGPWGVLLDPGVADVLPGSLTAAYGLTVNRPRGCFFFFLLFSPPAVILKTDVFAHIWCFVMINNNILWFSWFALNRAGFIGSRSQPEGCDYRKVHPNLLHFCLDCLHLVLILEVMSRPWNSWRPSVALILLENKLGHVLLNKKHLKFFKTRSLT